MTFGVLFLAACVVTAAAVSMVYLELFKLLYVHMFQSALILGSVLCCLKLYAGGVEPLTLVIILAFAGVLLLWGVFWKGRLTEDKVWRMSVEFVVLSGIILSSLLKAMSGSFDAVLSIIVVMVLAIGYYYYTLQAKAAEAQAV